jgi:pimeloyl-ACP methyl ester carboxylesterase
MRNHFSVFYQWFVSIIFNLYWVSGVITYFLGLCQWIFSVLFDIFLLPGAGLLCLWAKLDSSPQKIAKVPILLLHGSGFNEKEWCVGKFFLGSKYGPVYSLNYDGIVSNDPLKGIDDYATGIVCDYIREITFNHINKKIILIGHSMGGFIASYYAEYVAEQEGVINDKLITIATPWQGTPTLGYIGDLTLKRYQQMSQQDDANQTRSKLVESALESERTCRRKYYNIWSTKDYVVPFQSGRLTHIASRCLEFNWFGHYLIVIWPQTWWQIRKWLHSPVSFK